MAIEKQKKTKVSYVLVGEIAPNEKAPPQSKLIVDTLKNAGGTLSKEELVALLSRPATEGGLTTRQAPDRILGFYRPKLVAAGILKEVKEEIEVEVEVPDKPAPEPKAEKPEKPAKKAKSVKGSVGEKKVEAPAAEAAPAGEEQAA
jgi:hypothetical protein